jgi:serine/threonine protein phosphatase 1
VIFGHTPLQRILMVPNKIGIDTGAVYGGKLTCLELPAQRVYTV